VDETSAEVMVVELVTSVADAISVSAMLVEIAVTSVAPSVAVSGASKVLLVCWSRALVLSKVEDGGACFRASAVVVATKVGVVSAGTSVAMSSVVGVAWGVTVDSV